MSDQPNVATDTEGRVVAAIRAKPEAERSGAELNRLANFDAHAADAARRLRLRREGKPWHPSKAQEATINEMVQARIAERGSEAIAELSPFMRIDAANRMQHDGKNIDQAVAAADCARNGGATAAPLNLNSHASISAETRRLQDLRDRSKSMREQIAISDQIERLLTAGRAVLDRQWESANAKRQG